MEITSNNGGQIKKLLSDPKRSLIGLSIPMIFSLLFTMFNNIADAMWVSGLGSNALAAIGIVTPLFIIIIGIGVGISAGVNSSIARFLGANKFKDAGNSGVHGIILSIVLSIIIPWIILIFLDPLICLIGGSNVLSLAHAYGFWIILGGFTIIIQNVFSGIYRSENNGFKATFPIALAAILNIILDPIFIYSQVHIGIIIPGLNMGVAGAAIATVISNFIALVLYIYWTYIKKSTILNMRHYERDTKIYKDIISVGVPASMEQILMSVFNMLVNVLLVMVASTLTVAVFTTVWRLVSIGIMFPVGIGTGCISVFGALYGAKKTKTLIEMFKYTHIIGFISVIIIGILTAVFAKQLAILFGGAGLSSEIIRVTVIMSVYVMFSSLSIISGFIFQSFGKGSYSLIFTFFKQILLTLLFSFLLLFMKSDGVYFGVVIACIVGGIIELIFCYYYTKRLAI